MFRYLKNNTTKRERWFLLLILLVSLGIRIGYLLEMSQTLFLTQLRLDEQFHRNWAESIANGNILGDFIFFRAPLYAYWLGLNFTIFGQSMIIPRLLQHLAGTLGILFLYFLGRNVFGKRPATWATLLFAFYPPIIYNEDKFLFESILVPLLILFFALWYYARKNPRPVLIFCLGLLMGIICITRPLFLPVVFVLGIISIFSFKTGRTKNYIIQPVILFLLGTMLTLAPVTLRNYLIGGDFVLIASQGGINFYLGNNPTADGFSATMPGPAGNRWGNIDVELPVVQKLGTKPSAAEIDNYWRAEAYDFISESPGEFLALLGKKLYYFWGSIEIPNNSSFYLYEQFSYILRYIPIGFWILGPLGLFGIWIAWKEKRGRTLIVFILTYTLLAILFFVCDRFRLPVIPFLSLFAGLTIQRISELRKEQSHKKLIRWGAGIIVLFIVINSNISGFQKGNTAADNFALGNLELSAGNYKKAISHYEKIPPTNIIIPDVHLNWGTAEWKLGNYRNAIDQFNTEYANFPQSYEALANLAHLYSLIGNLQEAVWYSQRAIRLKPNSPIAYVDYAIALSELGRAELAESTLTSFLQTYPQDGLYEKSVLAGIQLMQGKTDLAEQSYRSILQRVQINRQPLYEPEYQYSREYRIGGSWDIFQAKIYYSLGHIFVQRQNHDSASAYFEKAVSLNPLFSDAWLDLGISQQTTGNLEKADSSMQTGLRIQPNNYMGWYNYGILMLGKNNPAAADSAFAKALLINPGFKQAWDELSLIRNGE